MKILMLLATSLVIIQTALAESERLKLPFGTGVMTCGEPDPRETRKDGTHTCTNHYKPTVPNAKFTLKNGQLEGKQYGYTEDGEPAYEGVFKAGIEEGEVKTRYSKEKRRFEKVTQFRKGKREGVETEIGSNDNVWVRFYKNDQLEGYSYNIKDGRIDSLGDCESKGQRVDKDICKDFVIPGYEAKWKVWQKEQAEKEAQKEADRNRTVVRKNREGVVVERYTLKNAQVFGTHERYYDNGKPYLISEKEASRLLAEKEYFDDGQLKRESTYSKEPMGIEMKREEFYQNGKPKLVWTRTMQSDNTAKVSFKEFYDNGKVQTEGVRLGNKFIGRGDPMRLPYEGEIKTFDDKGNLIVTENYVSGKRDGLMREIGLGEDRKPTIYESTYEKGVLKKTVTIDKATKKTLRIQEFMPDGSTKSDSASGS